MKLETFFEKFDLFANAPDAVTKMRELVLELAVQGKLVEQMPAEGDGYALLRQIHKQNPPSVTETDAEPVDAELASFPSSWAPSKLGEVAEIIRGVTFPGSAKSETRSNGDVACLRTASVQAEIDWDDLIYISPSHVSRTDQWVAPNDIMISMANSYALVGKVAIVRQVPQKATFGAFLAAIRPILIEPYFLLYVLRSPRMQAAFRASSSQTTNIANISLGRMRPLPFPLPPLAEQKRIVAKVDELMALCDRLEAQQQERETRQAAIARASLARFAEAPTPANLDFLFHPSYAIPPADLRKSILTLAVQGKLVPQDPNDEPAEAILRATSALFDNLVAAKRLSSPKPLPPVEEGDSPFALPSGWVWCRLGQIIRISSGDGLIAKDMNDGPVPVYGGNGVNGYHDAHNVEKPTLVIGRVGFYCGSIHVTPEKAWVTDNAFITTFDEEHIDIGYLSWLLKATDLRERHNATAQPVISGSKVYPIILALPPLAEQRRILAKVDELMVLVDALETQFATDHTTAANLVNALVAELTATC